MALSFGFRFSFEGAVLIVARSATSPDWVAHSGLSRHYYRN
jgi:hypothetical protein